MLKMFFSLDKQISVQWPFGPIEILVYLFKVLSFQDEFRPLNTLYLSLGKMCVIVFCVTNPSHA